MSPPKQRQVGECGSTPGGRLDVSGVSLATGGVRLEAAVDFIRHGNVREFAYAVRRVGDNGGSSSKQYLGVACCAARLENKRRGHEWKLVYIMQR